MMPREELTPNEQIFTKVCQQGMHRFDLEKFKKEYRVLFGCIMTAMGEAHRRGFNRGRQPDFTHSPHPRAKNPFKEP